MPDVYSVISNTERYYREDGKFWRDRVRKNSRRNVILAMLIIALMLCIWIVMKPQAYKPKNELIDTSVMGEEAPVKIVTLNSYMTENENYEIAYLLGNKGNLYVLCHDTERFYVDLWHPEFWKDIEVVDICAERPWLYAAALDREGNVYTWKKE